MRKARTQKCPSIRALSEADWLLGTNKCLQKCFARSSTIIPRTCVEKNKSAPEFCTLNPLEMSMSKCMTPEIMKMVQSRRYRVAILLGFSLSKSCSMNLESDWSFWRFVWCHEMLRQIVRTRYSQKHDYRLKLPPESSYCIRFQYRPIEWWPGRWVA